jgi:hypothetical protein
MNEMDELREVENVNMYTVPGVMIVIEIPTSILPMGEDGIIKIVNKPMANMILGYIDAFIKFPHITVGAKVLSETIIDYIEQHLDEL